MQEYITTYSGIHIVPTDPQPEQIRVEDVAHALSLICRGNGQVQTFYSVGQHCIACAEELIARGASPRIVLAGLLHDAGEAYLSDVPRPFKHKLDRYVEYEERLLHVIYTGMLGRDLTADERARIKAVDDDLLAWDLEFLLREKQTRLPTLHVKMTYEVQPFEEVEKRYLELFRIWKARVDAETEM